MYSLSSRLAIQGTQPVPASMNASRTPGKRTGTPVSSIETRLATIARGCASECTASAVRNCSSWNGKTGKIASTLWIASGRPGLLRGVVDGVVELVPVEDLQARGGEVGADVAGFGRVPADLLGARDRILRRDHDRARARSARRGASGRRATRCTPVRARRRTPGRAPLRARAGDRGRARPRSRAACRARVASRPRSSTTCGRFDPPGHGMRNSARGDIAGRSR